MRNSFKYLPVILGTAFSLVLLFGSLSELRAQSNSSVLPPFRAAEEWVKQQVANEEDADLSVKFGNGDENQDKRRIRGSFLVKLLKNPPKGKTGPLIVIRIVNAVVVDEFDLSYSSIPYYLILSGCHFKEAVSFYQSKLQDLDIDHSVFDGAVRFARLKLTGTLNAGYSVFTNQSQPVNFEYAQIGTDLDLNNATFEEGISLLRAHISQTLFLDDTKFLNHDGIARFENMRVEGPFLIRKSEISCAVNFLSATMGAFVADCSHFNSVKGSSFYGMKVNGDADFYGVVFNGPVLFRNAEVTKDFDATCSHFAYVWKPGETRDHNVTCENATCGQQSQNGDDETLDADFFSMKVGGNAIFNWASFDGGLSFVRMDIGGNLEFTNVNASNPVKAKNFAALKADNLVFDDVTIRSPYYLNGMSYRLISDVVTQNWEKTPKDDLLRFMNRSEYSPDNPDAYMNLEAFYKRQGNVEGARAMHIAWKKRERSELGFERHPFKFVWNVIEYVTTGYGQHLEIALLWGAGFVVLGAFVFRREEWMHNQTESSQESYQGSVGPIWRTARRRQSLQRLPKRKYRPVWYSLALFLPIVSLEDARIWAPKPERKWSRFYMRLHIILGYLLIPIGLAAWTGIIK